MRLQKVFVYKCTEKLDREGFIVCIEFGEDVELQKIEIGRVEYKYLTYIMMQWSCMDISPEAIPENSNAVAAVLLLRRPQNGGSHALSPSGCSHTYV